ncbi:MAG: 50S ribosomal protein L9 [Armatimonadota bacterium]|nr:50S ribosomal protein L9 [Armatimonadota bacterium]MDR7438446.1 50S ribosomal protein L9 [Armatimonadota bacterium]MDR7563543.1 50S ribosomal protein L9 [Armatimonadota bacterium]MDR7567289.1 50S ribosomal protein L9 [Armatimonadota bacterium]MDR7602172.1 50S ribosomal protein L9 [Armatimonadota bacterium]
MKVILTRDVPSLGKAGSVVEVKEGYARNYLIPRGLAVEATEGALRSFQEQQEAAKRRAERERARARELAHVLSETSVVIRARAGEGGRLFGSVTAEAIREALRERGVEVSRKQIELPEPIKAVGTYEVLVHLGHGLAPRIRVRVEAQ